MIIPAILFILIAFVPYGYYLYRIKTLHEKEYFLPQTYPEISIVINAYKEGDRVRKRMKNLRETFYPEFKIHYYIVNDGHDEKTEICAREYYGVPVTVFSPYERMGKIACINYMLETVDTDIVVFTDADVTNDRHALEHLIASFRNPLVGAVSSDVIPYGKDDFSTANEKAYRSIYGRMCEVDSRDYSTFNFNGQMLACRRSAVPKISEIGADDANIAIQAVKRGYRAVYNKNVKVFETQPTSPFSQFKQKIRRANGLVTSFLNIGIKHPKCDNIIRMRTWMLVASPLSLLLALICICMSWFPFGLIAMGGLFTICFVFPNTLVTSFIINQIYLLVGLVYRKNIKTWGVVKK